MSWATEQIQEQSSYNAINNEYDTVIHTVCILHTLKSNVCGPCICDLFLWEVTLQILFICWVDICQHVPDDIGKPSVCIVLFSQILPHSAQVLESRQKKIICCVALLLSWSAGRSAHRGWGDTRCHLLGSRCIIQDAELLLCHLTATCPTILLKEYRNNNNNETPCDK